MTVSGVTWPPTTASPRPHDALITIVGAVAGDRVGGEQDAGRVRGDQLLHHDGQRDVIVRDAVLVAVGDGARVPQRGPAALDRIEQAVAADVEVGVLLAREREVRAGPRRWRTNERRPARRRRAPGRPADLLGDRGGHVLPGEQRLRRCGIGGVDRPGSRRRTAVGLGGDVEPAGTGSPAAAILANDAPLPPTLARSAAASSSGSTTSTVSSPSPDGIFPPLWVFFLSRDPARKRHPRPGARPPCVARVGSTVIASPTSVGRTIVTGQVACRMQCSPTEPSTALAIRPRPRWPSTSTSAPSAASTRTRPGAPTVASTVTGTAARSGRARRMSSTSWRTDSWACSAIVWGDGMAVMP